MPYGSPGVMSLGNPCSQSSAVRPRMEGNEVSKIKWSLTTRMMGLTLVPWGTKNLEVMQWSRRDQVQAERRMAPQEGRGGKGSRQIGTRDI